MTRRRKTAIFLSVMLVSFAAAFTVYSFFGKSIGSKAESVLLNKKGSEYFKVSGLKAEKTKINSVTLSWDVLPEADGYNIFKYDDVTEKWVNIADSHKNNNEYTVVGLNKGCEYKFAVNAYATGSDEIANSPNCLSEITAVTCLPDVSGITASSGGGTYKISWNESASVDGYEIYFWDSANGCFVSRKKTLMTYSYIYESEDEIPNLIAVKAYKYIGDIQAQSENFCVLNLTTVKQSLKVYADGDSIAYGAGADGYSYADILSDEYGFDVTKVAVSGSTIAQNTTDETKDITKRVLANFNADYDYALIEGGVNDYYFGMPLGEVSEPLSEQFDTSTTCGGLETIFSYIRRTSPDTKIYFLATHKITDFDSTENSQGLTYLDYYNAILKICDKYCVTVINCYEESGLDTSDEAIKKAYTLNSTAHPDGDGIHPNLQGYIKYYMPVVLKAMKIS